MKKIWLALLSLLGFAGCDRIQEDMYGTPYAEYSVKGRVTDAAGRAIAGIEVRSAADASVRTDAQGTYAIGGYRDVPDAPVELTFTDTDGPANGGDFAAGRVEIRFSVQDLTDGRFERTGVDVVLDAKNTQ